MKKIIFLIAVVFYFSFCTNDIGKLQDSLTQNYQAAQCDTTTTVISYSTDIVPIMNTSCGAANTSCHSSGASSLVYLDFWGGVNYSASTGNFLSSITWDGTASNMPKNSPNKLTACEIKKITKWVNMGAPNN